MERKGPSSEVVPCHRSQGTYSPQLERYKTTLSVDGMKVNYIDVGSGPAILLVHGIGSSWHIWQSVIPPLATSRRVVAVDLPGFGGSEPIPATTTSTELADFVTNFSRTLGILGCSAAGHSLGGLVLMEALARTPKAFKHMVLIDAALQSVLDLYSLRLPESPTAALNLLRTAAIYAIQVINATVPVPGSALRLALRSDVLTNLMFWPYLADPSAVDKEHLLAIASNAGRWVSLAAVRAAGAYNYSTIASRVADNPAVAVTLVQGELDRVAPRENVPRFLGDVPHARVIYIRGAGHWPMVECPATITDILTGA